MLDFPVMRVTLCLSAGKTICGKCSRPVQMVSVDGAKTAVDPEVIAVVPSGRLGEAVAVDSTVTGRRLHAGLCQTYQMAAERDKIKAELAAYNKRNRTRGKRRTL